MVETEAVLKELRKEKKRSFIQSVDLIINLQNFDARKESLNAFVQIPNPDEKKICGFLTKNSKLVDTITKEGFDKFKEAREIKRLAKKYDFFIAAASLMGLIATKFGRVLGPIGKMPSPQAGIMAVDSDEAIKNTVEKMKKLVRIRSKENSLKISIGKESMSDKELEENIKAVLHAVENILPRKKANIKNVIVKFTMTKPLKITNY